MGSEVKKKIDAVDEAVIEFEQAVWAMVDAQREASDEVYRRFNKMELLVADCHDDGAGYRMDASLERVMLIMQDNALRAVVDDMLRMGRALGFHRGYMARDMEGKESGNDC